MKSIKSEGFTFLELLIVISIISLITLLVMPRLTDPFKQAGKSDVFKVAAMLRFVRDSAILYREDLLVNFEIDRGVITYESPEGGRKFKKTLKVGSLRGLELPDRGVILEGMVSLKFTPEGYPSPFRVLFSEERSISYNPFSTALQVSASSDQG